MKLITKILAGMLAAAACLACSKSSGSDPAPSAQVTITLKHATVEAAGGRKMERIYQCKLGNPQQCKRQRRRQFCT